MTEKSVFCTDTSQSDKYYTQNPNLVELKDLNLTSLHQPVDKNNITSDKFVTLRNAYGDKLDTMVPSLMLSSRRITIAEQWSGELLELGIHDVKGFESGKENDIMGYLVDTMTYFQKNWDQFLKTILLWVVVLMISVFIFLWIIGVAFSICKNGPKSSITARILMAPLYMFCEAVSYLLVRFGLMKMFK